MEHAQPSKNEKDELHRKKFEEIYKFFVDAEKSKQPLTRKDIQQQVLRGSENQTRVYVMRYWSWFLHPISPKQRPYTYLCQGISGYPVECFVLAHKPNHMRYFREFAASMEQYDTRPVRPRPVRRSQSDEASTIRQNELNFTEEEREVQQAEAEQQAPAPLPVIGPLDLDDEPDDDVYGKIPAEDRTGDDVARPQDAIADDTEQGVEDVAQSESFPDTIEVGIQVDSGESERETEHVSSGESERETTSVPGSDKRAPVPVFSLIQLAVFLLWFLVRRRRRS